jgi:hypothetical protein
LTKKSHTLGYYVVYDPWLRLGEAELYVYELSVTPFGRRCILRDDWRLPGVGLALTFWQGEFEGVQARWLRWCAEGGGLVLSGKEKARQATARAERLAAKLRELGCT